MRIVQKSGFTLVELIIASSLTALLVLGLVSGVNSVLDHKQLEISKQNLAMECFQILNLMERDIENKTTSMGNLFYRDQAYTFEYNTSAPIENHPSLSFFRFSEEGPVALCYSVGSLPNAIQNNEKNACGLFRATKTEADSYELWNAEAHNLSKNFSEICTIDNIISESIVHFEIHLVKLKQNDVTLEYLNTSAENVTIFKGKGTCGSNNFSLKQLSFIEVTLWAVSKSQQAEYWAISDVADRQTFVQKKGIKLSRMIPFYF